MEPNCLFSLGFHRVQSAMNSLCVPAGRLFITTIKSHSAVINQRFKGTYMYSTHIEKHYKPTRRCRKAGRKVIRSIQTISRSHTYSTSRKYQTGINADNLIQLTPQNNTVGVSEYRISTLIRHRKLTARNSNTTNVSNLIKILTTPLVSSGKNLTFVSLNCRSVFFCYIIFTARA